MAVLDDAYVPALTGDALRAALTASQSVRPALIEGLVYEALQDKSLRLSTFLRRMRERQAK